MTRSMTRRAATRCAIAAAACLVALVVAGCGSSTEAPRGLTVAGPGSQTGQPPWRPEYAHLPQRLKQIGIPPGGSEKFHIHAMLHIYVDGLLSPVPADIGIDSAHGTESSMHTHDATGVIHMEAPKPFPYTLGDFFGVWGVTLGPAQVGGLSGLGGDHLHFLVNGRPLADPAAYHLHNGDSVVIGYGPINGFPHTPSTYPLYEVEHGLGGLGCSSNKNGKKGKSCLATPPKTSTTKSK